MTKIVIQTSLLLLVLFGIQINTVFGQSDTPSKIDSLKKIIEIATHDTTKVNALNTLAKQILYSEPQKAYEYANKALALAQEAKWEKGIARSCHTLGNYHYSQFDYPQALDLWHKALKIYETSGNKTSMAKMLGNIGIFYSNQSDYPKALNYYFKVLKIMEETENKNGITKTLDNIGIVYKYQSDYPKALDYYFKALKIHEELGYKIGIVATQSNIGSLYVQSGNYLQAEKHLQKALILSEEIGEIYHKKFTYSHFSDLYTKTGRYKEALEMYKKHVELRDSINSEENQKALVQKEMQFEYEKKSAIDSIAYNKEKEIKDAKIAQQQTEIKAKRNQQYALFGGMFLVIIFAGVMYNRFRVTRKQKVIIEEKERETHAQKEIIEEKHKEITDSINYAERIQRSFLATTEMLDEYLNDYFVFFRPKDVVSGDFYWAAKLNNGNFAFACADSTGHGVPGAIMSILNIFSLEKSIETQTEPHKILHETRKIIINRLKKDGSAEGGKDGMDCSLLVLNQEKNHLTFASANNSVFIIRNGEILEFKGDKMPVGKHDNADEIFTLHSVDLQKSDVIYSLTDGFPDQFGGNKGKKYMIKNLKNLLLEIAALPLKEQEEKLANEFDNWKGNEEQVDDVCIIGVRV